MTLNYTRINKQTGEKQIIKGVPNLTFENLSSPLEKSAWLCLKCNERPMDLYPINRSLPITDKSYWECRGCKRQISVEERDGIFEAVRQNVLDKYHKELEVFNYNKENNTWDIKGRWQGQSRHTAKRMKITQGTKRDLIDELLNNIEDTLSINVNNLRDYFIE